MGSMKDGLIDLNGPKGGQMVQNCEKEGQNKDGQIVTKVNEFSHNLLLEVHTGSAGRRRSNGEGLRFPKNWKLRIFAYFGLKKIFPDEFIVHSQITQIVPKWTLICSNERWPNWSKCRNGWTI